MNLIRNRSVFKLTNGELIRNYNNSSKPYEEVEPRRIENRRYGYKSRYHEKGLMPRLRDQERIVKSSNNGYRPNQLNWAKKNSLMGQNDYIDILGNDKIKPYEILKDVPWFLKGFGGNELQMLTRLQVAKSDWRFSRPKKWKEMQGRMDFLYKYFNFRHKPPFLK